MQVKEIKIEEYIARCNELPIIDVRSPGEFEKGNIPNAINIPLFTNEERAKVGTLYKQVSREKAIEVGYKFVNPKLDRFISESAKHAPDKKVVIHCWRGGMRSNSFAGHLIENGFSEVYIIEGGYKAFRNYVLSSFDAKYDLKVLGGYTGSGKTHILKHFEDDGEQVLDLEAIACHKGSAFGSIGCSPQPTIEQFENNLFWRLKDLDISKPIWAEDESTSIGSVTIPKSFFVQMRSANVYFLDIPREERAKHLVTEYTNCDNSVLANSIDRISKRLGGVATKNALEYLEQNNYYEVALLTLHYYDKFYKKGLSTRDQDKVFIIEVTNTDHKENAKIVKSYINNRDRQLVEAE